MDHIKIDDPRLRKAMFKVFGGKCFYTGREVSEGDMVIDHVIPKSKGGEDSVYNYALTTKDINSKKSATIDKEGVGPVLYLIKMVYAPKVLKILQSYKAKKQRRNMKRTTIYVEEGDWADIKESAWMRRQSIGDYLIGLHEKTKKKIEMKNGSTITFKDDGGEKHEGAPAEVVKGLIKKGIVVPATHQERKDKVAVKVLADPFFNPQSKSQQTGKKVKKEGK